jgi:hypothetical protein
MYFTLEELEQEINELKNILPRDEKFPLITRILDKSFDDIINRMRLLAMKKQLAEMKEKNSKIRQEISEMKAEITELIS